LEIIRKKLTGGANVLRRHNYSLCLINSEGRNYPVL